jgi:hypothetical protein
MSTLRQRAINGDVAAINDLIYAQLGGQGLLVTVQKDAARCLTIRLQGEAVPDPTVYQDYIIDGLQQLRPLDIQSIRVVGEAFDPAVSPETPWEARVPIAKPRRSLRHQLQNPRSSDPSGQGAERSSVDRRIGKERSRSLGQSSSRSPQVRQSQVRQSRLSRSSDRAAPNPSYLSLLSTARQTVSQLVPAPSGPPGAWLPLWLEWFLVTGVLTLLWSLGINVPGGNVLMAAAVVYLQTCVVARRLPEARAWLTVSSLTTLLAIVLLPLPGPVPGVGPIQGIGQSWVFRRTFKEPLSWAIFHGLMIVAAYIVSLEINSQWWPLVLVGYVLTSTGLVARCLGTFPEQLPVPPTGIAAYGQAFLRRPWQSAEQAAAPPTNTGSATYTVSSVRVMVSETLGGLFVGQNLWAIWLLASAAITGLSLWLFTSFSDRFAGLMMFGLVVVLAQVVLIAVPLVLYVLIVLMSSPPRMAVGWQVPGLMLFGISLLQLLVISSVIVRGSG